MSAQRVGVFAIAFPDPRAINYDNNNFDTLNDTLGFRYRIPGNIQTLSTKDVDSNIDPYGILYVPDLSTDDCRQRERQYVAPNATRLANLPDDLDYAFIAIAPWFSEQCTLEYFDAARQVPTKAFFTYQPGSPDTKPPVLNDPSWNLGDGGSWQKSNTFPTYAFSSLTGANIVAQLALYSGNLSTVPHGDALSHQYAASEYVRLWATVTITTGTQLPSLWVFLVIVLAILILAVSITSFTMHVLQRRRRASLRERVIAGEVNLEQLGVKRLTVPQHLLDSFPVYAYTTAPEDATTQLEKSADGPSSKTMNPSLLAAAKPSPENSPSLPYLSSPMGPASVIASASWSQPTCPICLDEFEHGKTQVRELPCRHIFHPDCIDAFLLNNSSLCPMCKQSALPKGECPIKITNVMVRRERQISRMRLRATNSQVTTVADESNPSQGAVDSTRNRIAGAILGHRILGGRTLTQPTDIEMENPTDTPVAMNTLQQNGRPAGIHPMPSMPPGTQDCAPTDNRREWARQRALAMLGTHHSGVNIDIEQEDTGPRWRRGLRKVFPGF